MNPETRKCQNCKKQFIIESDDFGFYEKINVPPPTWCPSCRFMRRLSFYNERTLYKRNCDLCRKGIVAMFPPEVSPVYCPSCWFSDNWDPGSFYREYDPKVPFLKQTNELIHASPKIALNVEYPTLVNSDYINHAGTSKNCYLIFGADNCENVMYSTTLNEVRDSMDCLMLVKSELCYGDVSCGRSSRLFFSEECVDCTNVWFSRDCRSSNNCFGCIGLRKKNYYFFNEPLSKEEYTKRVKEFRLYSRKGLEEAAKRAQAFWLTRPHRYAHLGSKNVNVTGDYVFSASKNSKDLYYVLGTEDSRFVQFITMPPVKDCYDYTLWGNGAERLYECHAVGQGARDVKYSIQTWGSVLDVEYSFWVTSSSHMFGCTNLRKKEYCILNKQYSKEDYAKLRAEIIRDMNERPYVDAAGIEYKYGEFFPPELSLHAYNETQAMDLFPLTEEKAKKKGYLWKELPFPKYKPTLTPDRVPDSIHDVTHSILSEILECERCKKPFRMVKPELELLKHLELPVPVQCFNCRYLARWTWMNPPQLWDRTCAKCGAAVKTSYAPDRPEIVYCENCYQAEVV